MGVRALAGWLLFAVASAFPVAVVALFPGCGKPKRDSGKGAGAVDYRIPIEQKEGEMLLPKEIPGAKAHMVQVYVGAKAIRVQGDTVLPVENGKVDGASKRDGPDGFFIDPLYKRMKREAGKRKESERQGGLAFRGEAMLVVDKGTPYRLLAEVLYTMNQAEFADCRFVIAKHD